VQFVPASREHDRHGLRYQTRRRGEMIIQLRIDGQLESLLHSRNQNHQNNSDQEADHGWKQIH
jgi:hypothetical protein